MSTPPNTRFDEIGPELNLSEVIQALSEKKRGEILRHLRSAASSVSSSCSPSSSRREVILWLEIARSWHDGRETIGGLCGCVDRSVSWLRDLSNHARNALTIQMEERLECFAPRDDLFPCKRFFWPSGACWDERATAACLLAAMAESEEEV